MPQKRSYDFLADDDTASLNRWRNGLFNPGVYFGYDFAASANMNLGLNHATTGFTDVDKNGAIVTGQALVVTRQGFIIKEDSPALAIGPVTNGDATHPRIDVVVLTHAYIETGGGAQALYSIIQGTPAASPVAPALTAPATQIKIGELFVPTGTTALNQVGVIWTRSLPAVFGPWSQMIYLRNVTSDIQIQLNAKQALIDASNRLNANLVGTGVVDNTEYSYLDGVTSGIQGQINAKQATITGAATTITSANLTVNRALASDGAGKVIVSAVLDSEQNQLIGVSGNIQTQLNGKEPTITGAASTITSANLLVSRIMVSNSSGKAAAGLASEAESNFLVGVTSSIQVQLNAKQATITGAATTITSSDLTVDRVVISSGAGKIIVSSVTSIDLLQVPNIPSKSDKAQPSWTNLVVLNGWVNVGPSLRYRILDQNKLELAGIVAFGSASSPIFANLPNNTIPSTMQMDVMAVNLSDNAAIQLAISGGSPTSIQLVGGASGKQYNIQCCLALDAYN